jgi:hypothetical protein
MSLRIDGKLSRPLTAEECAEIDAFKSAYLANPDATTMEVRKSIADMRMSLLKVENQVCAKALEETL